MGHSKRFFVSLFVVLSAIAGCASKNSGGGGGSAGAGAKLPSNDNISFEKKAVDASRLSFTIVKPETVQQLKSVDTTVLMTVEGQVLSRSDAESQMSSRGATACGLTFSGVSFVAGSSLKLSEVQAGLIEGTANTHQLIMTKRESTQKTFAVYCAKLGAPVTLNDVKTALRGIMDVTYE